MSHLSYLAKRFYRTRERLTEIKRKLIPVVSFFCGLGLVLCKILGRTWTSVSTYPPGLPDIRLSPFVRSRKNFRESRFF